MADPPRLVHYLWISNISLLILDNNMKIKLEIKFNNNFEINCDCLAYKTATFKLRKPRML